MEVDGEEVGGEDNELRLGVISFYLKAATDDFDNAILNDRHHTMFFPARITFLLPKQVKHKKLIHFGSGFSVQLSL